MQSREMIERLLENLIDFLQDILIRWQKYRVELRLGGTRSKLWPKVRKAYLDRNPRCEVCGKVDGIEAHHIKMYSTYPELELDGTNLIGLCRKDHLLFGHINSFFTSNPNVRQDAEIWKYKIANRK